MKSENNPSLHIAVMGVTGSGKSTFIRTASGISTIEVGHGLESCTTKVEPFSFEYGQTRVVLIDTPGFNDTNMDEGTVLRTIAEWLESNYRDEQIKLNGIIYLQSIVEPRMIGSSLRNLRMFEKLCGENPMKNVTLVTTRWGQAMKAGLQGRAGQHEEQLQSEPSFWKGLISLGARIDRFYDSEASAMQIILRLGERAPITLQIQTEMVDESKELIQTAAGIQVNEDIVALEQRYKEELRELQEDIDRAHQQQQEAVELALQQAREEQQAKLAKIREQQDRLRFASRERDRRWAEEMQDLKIDKQKIEALLAKAGAQDLDFDQAVVKLEANRDKLSSKDREAMEKQITHLKKEPKKDRKVWKLVLKLLPLLGSVLFSLLGIPIMPGALSGLFGSDGGGGC